MLVGCSLRLASLRSLGAVTTKALPQGETPGQGPSGGLRHVGLEPTTRRFKRHDRSNGLAAECCARAAGRCWRRWSLCVAVAVIVAVGQRSFVWVGDPSVPRCSGEKPRSRTGAAARRASHDTCTRSSFDAYRVAGDPLPFARRLRVYLPGRATRSPGVAGRVFAVLLALAPHGTRLRNAGALGRNQAAYLALCHRVSSLARQAFVGRPTR
jgi:hypothetical protein